MWFAVNVTNMEECINTAEEDKMKYVWSDL